MALTDSWTNKDALAFTAGTLNTVTDCIIEVQGKLKRGTLSASSTPTSTQVQEWLIRAKEELAEVKLFTWRRQYVTLTCTAGTYIYALPADYGGQCGALRDVTHDRKIPIISTHQFDVLVPDPSAGTGGGSIIATVRDRELWLWPAPGADVFELEIYRTGDDDIPYDMTWLPEIDRYRCCDFALAESFEALQDFEKAAYYRQKWAHGLGKSKMADGKKKWSTMGYRARSVFQA
jgi:hypothetical protein